MWKKYNHLRGGNWGWQGYHYVFFNCKHSQRLTDEWVLCGKWFLSLNGNTIAKLLVNSNEVPYPKYQIHNTRSLKLWEFTADDKTATTLLEDNGTHFKNLTRCHITCLNDVTSESLDAETNESVKIFTAALFIK